MGSVFDLQGRGQAGGEYSSKRGLGWRAGGWSCAFSPAGEVGSVFDLQVRGQACNVRCAGWQAGAGYAGDGMALCVQNLGGELSLVSLR